MRQSFKQLPPIPLYQSISKITKFVNALYDANNTELVFNYVDAWSSTYTWGCNDDSCHPEAGDIVVISHGQHVTLDVDTPLLKALVIMGGTLEFDREIASKVTLMAEYIIVTQGGHFMIGTEENPFPCDKEAEVVLFGHVRSIRLPVFGTKVLAVRDGKLDLHGCRKMHTWGVLDSTATAGTNTLTIQQDISDCDGEGTTTCTGENCQCWKTGDKIVVATTGGRKSQAETEEHEILSVSGNTVTLVDNLAYDHTGVESVWLGHDGEARTFNQRAEVGLLSRNVVIRGNLNEEWAYHIPACAAGIAVGLGEVQTCFEGQFGEEMGSDQFGSQVMLQFAEYGKIEFIETTHAGQAFQLGRYPLHFHMSGDQPDSYIRGCSVHKTFNRCSTLHGVNFLTYEHNVCHENMGLAVFIEDGAEHDNTIQYNLVTFTKWFLGI